MYDYSEIVRRADVFDKSVRRQARWNFRFPSEAKLELAPCSSKLAKQLRSLILDVRNELITDELSPGAAFVLKILSDVLDSSIVSIDTPNGRLLALEAEPSEYTIICNIDRGSIYVGLIGYDLTTESGEFLSF